MKFQVLCGEYVVGDKTYQRGDVVTTDNPLDEMFVNAFKRVGEFKEDEPQQEPEPEDVSNNFPLAANNGLVVMQQADGKLNLFDKNDLANPLNEEPLTKGGINKLVKEFLA